MGQTTSQIVQVPQKTKEQLREEISGKRGKLSPLDVDAKSTVIAMQALSTEEFKGARTIFTYASYNNEVSTDYFIEKALLLGKRICVPKVNAVKNEMWPARVRSLKSLKPNILGIPEPGFLSFKVDPQDTDLIIVPSSVFDVAGHRIGSGKGYYDRYLAAHKGKAKTIGFAYDFQIVDKIPNESHDIAVDRIITEKRIIDCK